MLKELDILKNKDYSEVLVLVNYMVRAGIPIKTISDVNKQSRTSDGHNILEIIKLIERSGNNSSQSVFSLKNLKLTSLGILTAEEFSEEFLYENIKNKKSPLFFQNWINEKNWDNLKWTDFYFKILSSPLLGNKLAEKELNPWIRFLFSSPIYKSQKDVFVFIIKMYFKYEFWKVKETTLFHSQLLKELDIFKNNDYSEVVLLINYMVSSGIPMQIIADLNKNTITSDGQPIIDIIKSIQSAGNSTAQIEFLLKDRKLTSSGILTPEQFSETLLFKKIKNNNATLFFQKWIGEKDWSSEELKKLFQILNSFIISIFFILKMNNHLLIFLNSK